MTPSTTAEAPSGTSACSYSDYVRVADITPFWRYAVGPTSQRSPAIPFWTLKGAEAFFAEVRRELPKCGVRIYKRTRRGLVTVREHSTLTSAQSYREQWRDCCDCTHEKEISSNRCRKCFDDPARPDWVAKWANDSSATNETQQETTP